MDEIIILVIDPGTTAGWACSDGSSGSACFKGKRKGVAEAERHGGVADQFGRWLDAMLSRTGAGVLLVERQMTHGTSAHLLLGLRMVALWVGWRRRLAVHEVWASQWRPWAKRECPWWTKDDELDARAMLAWFQATRKILTPGEAR